MVVQQRGKALSDSCRWLLPLSAPVPPSSLYELEPTRLFCPWDSPGKNTGVGCHALLQRIFLTQGSNLRLLCLLHWHMNHSLPGSSVLGILQYWSGLPCPPPGDLSDPGTETVSLASPALQADSLLLSHQESPNIWIY